MGRVIKKKKIRLDTLLVERGVVAAPQEAQGLILSGQVLVDGVPVAKAGSAVSPDAAVEIKGRAAYASRGGLKLAGAIETFAIALQGKICADVGCSTGGFTDALLKHGASKVFAIDVGYGDLAWNLRTDARVVVMERTNATQLEALPQPIDFISVDVSLLSLRKVLPNVKQWLARDGEIVALIKPQYEASPEQLPEGAIIEDAQVHATILRELLEFCAARDLFACALTRSPIRGMGGNQEFLVRLSQDRRKLCDLNQLIGDHLEL